MDNSLPPAVEAELAKLSPEMRALVRRQILARPGWEGVVRVNPVAAPRQHVTVKAKSCDERAVPAACPYEGSVVERWRSNCSANVERFSLRQCNHPESPGTCARTANAAHRPDLRICHGRGCPLGGPAAPPFTRHLTYFVHPASHSDLWRWNVSQLRDRIGLFNGLRLVAISTARGDVVPGLPDRQPSYRLDPPEAVKDALAGCGCEFVTVPNDPDQGEVAAWDALRLRACAAAGPGDVTFYAHAKGTSYPADTPKPVRLWAKLLYEANLDYWPLVESAFLAGAHAVGSMRQAGGRFIYSGNFFWMHNTAAVARPRWTRPCRRRWAGVELWPGRVFKKDKSVCLFKDYPFGLQAYDPEWMDATYTEFVEWKRLNADHCRPHGVIA